MAKIITETLKKDDNTVEYVYPRTYALAVFLNNGETSVLDTIGGNWNKNTDKDLKTCSDEIKAINNNWDKDTDKNLKTCSDEIKTLTSTIETLTSTINSLNSTIDALTSRVSALENNKSNS